MNTPINCLSCQYVESVSFEKEGYSCRCCIDHRINDSWNQGASAGTLDLNRCITPVEYWNGAELVESDDVGPAVPFWCPLLKEIDN